MSDTAHLQYWSSDEDIADNEDIEDNDDDVYYSDNESNEMNGSDNIGIQNVQTLIKYQLNDRNAFQLRRPKELAAIGITTNGSNSESVVNDIEVTKKIVSSPSSDRPLNCCSVERIGISSHQLSDSKAIKAFNDLDKQLMKSLNALKCDQRLNNREWELRLESTFQNYIFTEMQLNGLLSSLDSLSVDMKNLDPNNACNYERSSVEESTRDVFAQTDISGLIVMEDIYIQ